MLTGNSPILAQLFDQRHALLELGLARSNWAAPAR
jgi:hypothetical protein